LPLVEASIEDEWQKVCLCRYGVILFTKTVMSKIQNNPLLKGASGMLGNVVVYREIRGKVIMSGRPRRRTGHPTPEEEQRRARFLRATQYARTQIQSPVAKEEYSKGINGRKITAYVVAVTDYLTPPVISDIDASRYAGVIGDLIAIRATDDFKVILVQVSVIAPSGALIEFGEARLQPGTLDDWRFAATVANSELPGTKLVVAAHDKAGNVTTSEKVL
jgi:hypothetical protein